MRHNHGGGANAFLSASRFDRGFINNWLVFLAGYQREPLRFPPVKLPPHVATALIHESESSSLSSSSLSSSPTLANGISSSTVDEDGVIRDDLPRAFGKSNESPTTSPSFSSTLAPHTAPSTTPHNGLIGNGSSSSSLSSSTSTTLSRLEQDIASLGSKLVDVSCHGCDQSDARSPLSPQAAVDAIDGGQVSTLSKFLRDDTEGEDDNENVPTTSYHPQVNGKLSGGDYRGHSSETEMSGIDDESTNRPLVGVGMGADGRVDRIRGLDMDDSDQDYYSDHIGDEGLFSLSPSSKKHR